MRIAVEPLRHRQPGLASKIAPALDVIAIMTIARRGRRQQDNAPRRRHLPRVRDGVFHRSSTVDLAGDVVPPGRNRPGEGINPLPAVAEADHGFGGAGDRLLDELAIVDTAIVSAEDDRYVAPRIDRQGCEGRFRYRGDAVVDKQHPCDLTQLLLAVRQSAEPAGRLESRRRIEIERLRHGQRRTQIGPVLRSREIAVAHLPDYRCAVQYLGGAAVNSVFVSKKILSRRRAAGEPLDEFGSGTVNDTD